ncbi:restriction endonuclease [Streptomyces sp. S1A1-7]|uniref:restriction endonuclease n=1 Tax=Streptomyces sp. S1A1-7 TaxID=2594459 RepID=UPI001164756A|nr:restriction endonuclease [Streptomyces sp. S1A1-7]QDN79467.1 restriction endonuclease [Streptomyces sp. S1A1-7]
MTAASKSPIDEFTALQKEVNPQRRGVAFERFLLRLVRASGLHAELNAPISLPRQTDLVASYGTQSYLIEAKWEKNPVSVEVVDSVESRLRRTHPSVVGVIISMSGFSSSCIEEVVRKRGDRAIVLLDRNDIAAAVEEPVKLRWILRTKHQRLVRSANVWFHDPVDLKGSPFWMGPQDDYSELVDIDGKSIPWFTNESGGSSVIFGSPRISVDEVEKRGVAVVKLFPDLHDLNSLTRLLTHLHDSGRCERFFRWVLSDRIKTWHGVGRASLTKALELVPKGQIEPISDGFGVWLHCHGGTESEFWALTADIYPDQYIDICELSFVKAELPLDLTRFHQISDAYGSWWESRVTWDYGVDFCWGSIEPQVKLDVAGYLVSKRQSQTGETERLIMGVIARNPFSRRAPFRKSGVFDPKWTELSHVLCQVAPWHKWSERSGAYFAHTWILASSGGANIAVLDGEFAPNN